MRPYILSQTSPTLEPLLERTRIIVDGIPNRVLDAKNKPIEISCHHVARVVAALEPKVKVIDGHILNGYNHSWLATPDPFFIIDPYPPVAYPGPWLIYMGALSPWKKIYNPERKPFMITDDFIDEAERILEAYTAARDFLVMP